MTKLQGSSMEHPSAHEPRLIFAPEFSPQQTGPDNHQRPPWKVMIIDDDDEVHSITAMVLRDFEFDGRRLEFVYGRSGEEGIHLIGEHPDTAVMLLDVVMETDQAGLEVVKYTREALHNRFVRIILRTGQPGEAPERTVIANYDINDYKEKAELTSDKLITSVLSALRAYRDISTIECSRRGLEQIICSSRKLFESQSLSQFCNGVLHQLTTLMNLGNDALYAHTSGFAAKRSGGASVDDFSILAATGKYANSIGFRIADLESPQLVDRMREAVEKKTAIVRDDIFVAYFRNSNGSENVIFTQTSSNLSDVDKRLLRIFATNIGAAFDNLHLNKELSQLQTELIFTLGGVLDSRCGETGQHVRRVAECSTHLATLLGLPKRDIELLQLGAPLHDLGKIGIPDAILTKRGALLEDELALMQRHTSIGYKILKGSGREALRSAALIALQHHEWWNGAGYPNGLVGEDVHLFARIVCVADVFDALTHRRHYKEGWSAESAFDYLHKGRGLQFDPHLVDVFLSDKDSFALIMNSHPDAVAHE